MSTSSGSKNAHCHVVHVCTHTDGQTIQKHNASGPIYRHNKQRKLQHPGQIPANELFNLKLNISLDREISNFRDILV